MTGILTRSLAWFPGNIEFEQHWSAHYQLVLEHHMPGNTVPVEAVELRQGTVFAF